MKYVVIHCARCGITMLSYYLCTICILNSMLITAKVKKNFQRFSLLVSFSLSAMPFLWSARFFTVLFSKQKIGGGSLMGTLYLVRNISSTGWAISALKQAPAVCCVFDETVFLSSSFLPSPRRKCFCQTLSVYLSVCQQDNSKKLWTDFSEILRVRREWHNLPVIQFWRWSGRNPRFWITLKFSLPLLSMRHKRNRCKTEDGAAT